MDIFGDGNTGPAFKKADMTARITRLMEVHALMKEPPKESVWCRFMGFIIMPEDLHSCWFWDGAHSKTRITPRTPTSFEYGVFCFDKRTYNVHRLWGKWLYGADAIEGLVIDHISCSNTKCINPAHLLPTTTERNNNRPGARTVTANNLKKTHCPRGHELTYENCVKSEWDKNNKRCCKICRADALRDRDQGRRLRAQNPRNPKTLEELFNEIKGRVTHCKNGHEIAWQNCVEAELLRGVRRCKACYNPMQAKRSNERYHAKKEAGLIEYHPRPERTHCSAGHELTPDNLVAYELTRGTKTCRKCASARSEQRHKIEKAIREADPQPRKPKKPREMCKKGHPLTDDNCITFELVKNNRRICKICRAEYNKEYKSQK